MEAYIILLISIVIIFIILKGEAFNKFGIPAILICLTLFFGLRNKLAMDDVSYMEIFKNVTLNNEVYVEKSFILICKITHSLLNMNYKFVFFVYAMTSFIFVYLIIKKLEIKKSEFWIFILSFIAFCFVPYLTAMRQFLAGVVFIFALTLFKEKKYIKTIILMIIAGLIHNSAYILIIFLPIFSEKVKINDKIKAILPLVAIVLANTNIISNILIFILQKMDIVYLNYVTNVGDASLTNSGLLIYLLYIIYVIQFLFKKYEEGKYDDIIEKGEMLFFVTFFSTKNLGFAGRISYFFMLFECFLFIALLKRTEESKNKMNLIVIITILIISLNMYQMLNNTLDMSIDNFSLNFWN